jgi:hypothetical protein
MNVVMIVMCVRLLATSPTVCWKVANCDSYRAQTQAVLDWAHRNKIPDNLMPTTSCEPIYGTEAAKPPVGFIGKIEVKP